MLGRVGSATIALGLTIAVSGALAQDRIEPSLESQPIPETRQNPGRQESQGHATQEEAEANRIASMLDDMIEAATRDLISEENAQHRARQEQREIEDLQAQQDMALWAKAMFWAAFASVILTFVGICLIAWTLYYTRRAADAAVAAVDKAKSTLEVTRDIGSRQLRAYVGTSRVYFRDFTPDRPISVVVEIQNFGQTPAYNYHTNLWLEVRPHPEAGTFHTKEIALTIGGETLMPGNRSIVICKFPHPKMDEIITAIQNAQMALYLLGTIRYRDAFGHDRYTNSRKRASGDRIKTNSPFINPDEGNESN
jgi:hypothetical protein